MAISPLAGKPALPSTLADVAALERQYYERELDLRDPMQLVSFGTSGHRGSSLSGPAPRTALEVLACNRVHKVIQDDDGVTPTPVVSRAILVHNRVCYCLQ